MKNFILTLLALMVFCHTPAYAETDLRALVKSDDVFFVLPEARKLDSDSIPVLMGYLHDPAMGAYGEKIVSLLGYMGKPQAARPLLNLIEKSEGELSPDQYRIVMRVFYALGFIAARGDPEALRALLDYTDADVWQKKNLKLSFHNYTPQQWGDMFARYAIGALGTTGKPQALARLRALQADPKTPANWQADLNSAIDFHAQVARDGIDKIMTDRNREFKAVSH